MLWTIGAEPFTLVEWNVGKKNCGSVEFGVCVFEMMQEGPRVVSELFLQGRSFQGERIDHHKSPFFRSSLVVVDDVVVLAKKKMESGHVLPRCISTIANIVVSSQIDEKRVVEVGQLVFRLIPIVGVIVISGVEAMVPVHLLFLIHPRLPIVVLVPFPRVNHRQFVQIVSGKESFHEPVGSVIEF